jgi:hypothetical protein
MNAVKPRTNNITETGIVNISSGRNSLVQSTAYQTIHFGLCTALITKA